MEKRTKRILVLIGAMGLFTGAWGCRDVNPFPSDSNAYTLRYRQGELHVAFTAIAVPSFDEDVTTSFHAKHVSGDEQYDTQCSYTDGDIQHGGAAECIVQIPDDLLPRESVYEVIIWVFAEGVNTMSGQTSEFTPNLDISRAEPIDTDSDGVGDDDDECADTPEDEREDVNERGCPDSDRDGVVNDDDECADTPEGSDVDENGCPRNRSSNNDPDGDGFNTLNESGAPHDNCPDVSNPEQADGDSDGIGDACDNEDGRSSGRTPDPPPWSGGAGPNGTGTTGAGMDAGEGCALVDQAVAIPTLFLLLCGALLTIAGFRRR